MKEFFQKMLRNKIIMAVFSIILGIVLIAGQGRALALLIRILGILLLIVGVIYLITYFAGSLNKGNPSTLASSILCILVALVFIMSPGWLVVFFPLVMGIVLIVNSIFTISAILSSPVRTGLFPGALLMSILSLILGFLAILHPGVIGSVLIIFIGASFLVNGIQDLLAIALMK